MDGWGETIGRGRQGVGNAETVLVLCPCAPAGYYSRIDTTGGSYRVSVASATIQRATRTSPDTEMNAVERCSCDKGPEATAARHDTN